MTTNDPQVETPKRKSTPRKSAAGTKKPAKTSKAKEAAAPVAEAAAPKAVKPKTVKEKLKAAKETTAPKEVKEAKPKAPRARKTAAVTVQLPIVSQDEFRRMVAERAYMKAADRGFDPSGAEDDWLSAESELMAEVVVEQ